MCTIHNEQLKFARKVTLPHSCFLSYPLYVSPSPPSRNWLQKSLSEKHEKLLTESKKKGNNTLRWSEKKCEQQVKVAFQADPPPLHRSSCWSALWPWTGNATMLKLLSRVENVQQIVWPRFQEQLTVIRAVVEKPDGASLLPRPSPCSTPTATTIELKSIKKSIR